jgi:hypothetical protein
MSMKHFTPQNFLLSNLIGFDQLYSSWTPVFDDERYEYRLRLYAVTIWLRGLVDFAKQQDRRSRYLRELSPEERAIPGFIRALKEVQTATSKILGLFSKEEQLILWFHRNALVHGHLSLYFSDDLGIDIFDAETGKVVRNRFANSEMTEAIIQFGPMSPNPVDRVTESEAHAQLKGLRSSAFGGQAITDFHEALFGKQIENPV